MNVSTGPGPALSGSQHIELVERVAAHNYKPLPVVVHRAEGVWVEDVDGERYMDMLAAYSAVNFGHGNVELLQAAREQLDRVTLTSRAFHSDQLGPMCEALGQLCSFEAVLPMNTGAEGVETAIKTARKWGYKVKGVPEGKARIVTCEGNFHGRTTTIVSFSTDPQCRDGFGPFTPGFDTVPYGDIDALRAAITDDTVGFLVEPIQGEAGIIVPPAGYLAAARALCTERNVLFIADEIQSGLGRTGYTLALDFDGVRPDILILGKALGGGVMPVSAVLASWDILGVFTPGDHGSTFGGNPLSAAVARKAIELLERGTFQENARRLGERMFAGLGPLVGNGIVRLLRGRGLWIGIEIERSAGRAKKYCLELMELGILCKDTHKQAIRLAPPLCITEEQVDWALERLIQVLGKAG